MKHIPLLTTAFLLLFLTGLMSLSPIYAMEIPESAKTSVSIHELLSRPEIYDQQVIYIEGEIVGQVLRRKDGAWFHLKDKDGLMIGIWTSHAVVDNFSFLGRHGIRGDYLGITGVYYKICPLHGGDTDIHLNEVVYHIVGHPLPKSPVSPIKAYFLILLFLSGLLLWLVNYRLQKKTNND